MTPHVMVRSVAALALACGAPSVRGDAPQMLRLRAGSFDPVVAAPVAGVLGGAGADEPVRVVQFARPILARDHEALGAAGFDILGSLPDRALVVRGDAVRGGTALRDLDGVRWEGAYEPAWRVAPEVWEAFAAAGDGSVRCSVLLWRVDRSGQAARRVASAVGAQVLGAGVRTQRFEAMLDATQVTGLARDPDVMFIDPSGDGGLDTDTARLIGGATFLADTLGFEGQGVRGEVADTVLNEAHVEITSKPYLLNGPNPPPLPMFPLNPWHGTRTYGILFARGLANPAARGMLPESQPIWARNDQILEFAEDRRLHIERLVDPDGVYRAVFQSNSWGFPRTTLYTTVSAEVDAILFDTDLVFTNSLGNGDSRLGRPEAWAKNSVGVGGIYHHNTPTRDDDCGQCVVIVLPPPLTTSPHPSFGPAPDGRFKPDLAHFYENVLTMADGCTSCYDPAFYGTSAASPLVAGHFGLLFQMWHEGAFWGHGLGTDVFDSRAYASTARALLINSAARYTWGAGGASHDLTRVRQGWGMPQLRPLYEAKASLLIRDQQDRLSVGQSWSRVLRVAPGTPEFRATMVFPDPAGNPAASINRVNDLTLRVTSPSGVVYWGNNGLADSNVSTPGGAPNTLDVVENVLIPAPTPGPWTVDVIASEINLDGDPATPEIDATFALVVAGTTPACPADCTATAIPGAPGFGAPDGALSTDDFFYYLQAFASKQRAFADLTTTATAGMPGFGVPDGVLDNDDFFYYLVLFAAGC